jgi:hypothetical protein
MDSSDFTEADTEEAGYGCVMRALKNNEKAASLEAASPYVYLA